MTSGKHLTPDEKARIIELIDKGLTSRQIATRFGLSYGTIWGIKRKRKQ